MTINTAKAMYPEGLDKPLKVPLNIPMSPETGGLTQKAMSRPGPGVLFAEFK